MNTFPQSAPIIQALARVIHPDLHPQTKIYLGKAIKDWHLSISLTNVLRNIQNEFNRNPPVPEAQAKSASSSASSMQMPAGVFGG